MGLRHAFVAALVWKLGHRTTPPRKASGDRAVQASGGKSLPGRRVDARFRDSDPSRAGSMKTSLPASMFALLAVVLVGALENCGCGRSNYALAKDCAFSSQAAAVNPIIPDSLGVNIHFTDPLPG